MQLRIVYGGWCNKTIKIKSLLKEADLKVTFYIKITKLIK